MARLTGTDRPSGLQIYRWSESVGQNRFRIPANGKLRWGSGGPANGVAADGYTLLTHVLQKDDVRERETIVLLTAAVSDCPVKQKQPTDSGRQRVASSGWYGTRNTAKTPEKNASFQNTRCKIRCNCRQVGFDRSRRAIDLGQLAQAARRLTSRNHSHDSGGCRKMTPPAEPGKNLNAIAPCHSLSQ